MAEQLYSCSVYKPSNPDSYPYLPSPIIPALLVPLIYLPHHCSTFLPMSFRESPSVLTLLATTHYSDQRHPVTTPRLELTPLLEPASTLKVCPS